MTPATVSVPDADRAPAGVARVPRPERPQHPAVGLAAASRRRRPVRRPPAPPVRGRPGRPRADDQLRRGPAPRRRWRPGRMGWAADGAAAARRHGAGAAGPGTAEPRAAAASRRRRPGGAAGPVHRPPALHVVAGARRTPRGLAAAAREQGVGAVALTDVTERFRVELLVSRALQLQARDPALADEQQPWLDRRRGDGVPVASVPDRAAADESHRSRFGIGTLEDDGRDVEGSDGLVVLCAERRLPRGLAARRRGSERAVAARRTDTGCRWSRSARCSR